MAKGRKRKAGKRTPSGRLSRAGVGPDRGSEWVQAMRDKFGEYYNSPIGRAFASGLLGEGNEAKDRLDKARKFIALYGAVIGKDRYRCPLDSSPRGGVVHEWLGEDEANERDGYNEDWMRANLKGLDDSGCRPFFDQLTSSLYTDTGPAWLERLIWEGEPDRRDTMVLEAALKGIDTIRSVKSTNRLTGIANCVKVHKLEHGALRLKGFG